jgi:hypothetical protein
MCYATRGDKGEGDTHLGVLHGDGLHGALEDQEVLGVDVDAELLQLLEVGLGADGLAVDLVVGGGADDGPVEEEVVDIEQVLSVDTRRTDLVNLSSAPSSSWKMAVTAALLATGRPMEAPWMRSDSLRTRSELVFSPMTKEMASMKLLLPEPFGPMTATKEARGPSLL